MIIDIKTPEEAKKIIHKWLVDNEHSIKELKDDTTTFNFEIDYPGGQQIKQVIVQPQERPDLIIVAQNVGFSPEHLTGLQKMKSKPREAFIKELSKEFLFKENQYRFVHSTDGTPSGASFSCLIYFDGLSKNNLYKALDINFKSFLYLSMVLTEKFGGPSSNVNPPGYG